MSLSYIVSHCNLEFMCTRGWLWTRLYITPERTRTRRLHWSGEESPMRHKRISLRSNDRVGQRNSLPISSVRCRSLSGRYVNFITPKEAEVGGGWQQSRNSRRCRIRFTYFSVDHIDRLSRGSTFTVQRNNVEVIPTERSRWDYRKKIFAVPTR